MRDAVQTDFVVIDREVFSQLLESEAEYKCFIKDMISLLPTAAGKYLKAINDAVAREDFNLLESSAHGLRSTVSYFGAQEVCHFARCLEANAKTGDRSTLRTNCASLDQAYRRFHAEIVKIAF